MSYENNNDNDKMRILYSIDVIKSLGPEVHSREIENNLKGILSYINQLENTNIKLKIQFNVLVAMVLSAKPKIWKQFIREVKEFDGFWLDNPKWKVYWNKEKWWKKLYKKYIKS